MVTERTGGGTKWERIKVGDGHYVMARPIDPKILKQMPPPGSKPFIQVGLIEFAAREIKSILNPNK